MDHNDVDIIDDGQMEGSGAGERHLNRQTDNMGAVDFNQHENNMDPDDMGAYGDEVINHQNSSNFNVDHQEDEGLEQLHDQLKNLD